MPAPDTQTDTFKILRVDASMRHDGSTSRQLADRLIERLSRGRHAVIAGRDLAKEAPRFVDAAWIGANFTDPAERDETQKAALAESDALIAELKAADTLVIATPVYNFSVPAALKAWFDMIARARETFRYTENGPEGLLSGKKAYIVIASGGTAVDSEIDFATPWLRHMMGFIGIDDVEVIPADRLMFDADASVDAAHERIAQLAA